MSRPQYATVLTVVGSDDVEIVSLHEDRDQARYVCCGNRIVLPIYYRRGSQPMRLGDRVPTWREGSTRWVMP